MSSFNDAVIEPLERRQLLSAYSLLDVSWIPGHNLSPGKITNSGLFTVGSSAGGYVTMVSRHKAYKTPSDFFLRAVNSSGELVVNPATVDKTQIDANGLSSDLPQATGVGAIIGPTSGSSSALLFPSVSDSGRIVGTIQCNTPGQITSSWFSVIAEYDPATKQTTAISAIGTVALEAAAFVNDSGTIAYGAHVSYQHPSIYNPTTHQVTVIPGTDDFAAVYGMNNNNQVIGTGFFYDPNNATLLMFTSSREARSSNPASINDAGVIVGNAQFRVKVRHHYAWVQHAAIFADGKLVDVNTLVAADEIITSASSINDAGQILASTAKGSAIGVCILSKV